MHSFHYCLRSQYYLVIIQPSFIARQLSDLRERYSGLESPKMNVITCSNCLRVIRMLANLHLLWNPVAQQKKILQSAHVAMSASAHAIMWKERREQWCHNNIVSWCNSRTNAFILLIMIILHVALKMWAEVIIEWMHSFCYLW